MDNFHHSSSEWIFPELKQLRWGHRLGRLADAVYALSWRRPEYSDDNINTMSAQKLTDLPSFDRWLILKEYLQNSGFVPQERLDAFEDTLIRRMVNEVLIAGGHESWAGTAVTSVLRKLGSPRALAPLLYYQTYISGAHGLYKAGHTNAAAQRSLETLLRKMDPADIEKLNTPQFVKEALLTLKDISDQPMGDAYNRSYLTAGLVARKFKEAAQDIKDNPNYKNWLVALLRGIKNSSQPFSQESYDVMLSFLDLDPSASLEHEIIQTLAFRIHNKEQLGINTRVNPDFPMALDSLFKVINRPDFHKSAQNFAAIYHIISQLQTSVKLQDYSDADIAKVKLFYTQFQTTVGIPSKEEMELSRQYKDKLVEQLAEWMKDPTLPSDVRFITLQIFDLVGYDYDQTTEDIAALYQDRNLANFANQGGSLLADSYLSISFMRDINLHGYYECLTDLLLRRYVHYGDLNAKNLIVSTYIANSQAREGISEWLKHWGGDTDKYEEENPEKMQAFFDQLNDQILTGPDEVAGNTINLFGDLTYFRHNTYVRNLFIADLDKVSEGRKALLFKELVRMVRNEEHWVESEEDIQGGRDEEYRKNRQFGQETVRLVSEKMWEFLDSSDITEQFWAIYTLNLYNESGEKFREVVDKLLLETHSLEQAISGATKIVDGIKERLVK